MPPTSSDYDDSDQAPPSDDAPEKQDESKGDDYPTAMLPKAMFGDPVNPGDTITLKVEKVDEDNVICCKDDSGKDEKPAGDEPEQASMPGSMSSMMED